MDIIEFRCSIDLVVLDDFIFTLYVLVIQNLLHFYTYSKISLKSDS